jgi:hypothetical protein
VLADGPASYYELNDIASDTKGRVAFDASSHCHNGALRYGDQATTGSVVGDPVTGITGTPGFTAPSSALPGGATARTVEFWETGGGDGDAFVQYGDFGAGNGFIVQSDNGALQANTGSGVGNISVAWPYNLNDGNWHLIDGVFNGSTITFYVDGTDVGGGPLGGLTTDPSRDGVYAFSRGALDEVAIYPTALSATQIEAHWTASGR